MGLDVGPAIKMLVLEFGIGNAVVVAVVFLVFSTGRGSVCKVSHSSITDVRRVFKKHLHLKRPHQFYIPIRREDWRGFM